MSEILRRAKGFADVLQLQGAGMIAIRADLADTDIAAAIAGAAGVMPPERLSSAQGEGRALWWMSPDELLLVVPQAQLGEALDALRAALAGRHATIADVSDMRALFRVDGPRWREVLAKLTPADMAPGAFPPGMVRRSHLAQAAAAIRAGEAGAEVLCFASVAQYMFTLLTVSAAPGSELGLWPRPDAAPEAPEGHEPLSAPAAPA